MMNPFLQVAVGGAIGSVARYGVYRLMPVGWSGFPAATMIVNVTGSFVMGLLAALLAHRGGQHLAPLLLTGVLGGYTTFSAFSLDILTLYERGQGASLLIYLLGSVVISLVMVVAGMSLGRAVFA